MVFARLDLGQCDVFRFLAHFRWVSVRFWVIGIKLCRGIYWVGVNVESVALTILLGFLPRLQPPAKLLPYQPIS